MKNFKHKALILILILILSSPAIHAFEAEVTSDERKTVQPEEMATYGLRIENTTEEETEAEILDNLPAGWSIMSEPVEIPPAESRVLFVSIAPDYTVQAGAYDLSLEIEVDGEVIPAELPVEIKEHRELNLKAPVGRNVAVGEEITYTFWLRNRGNVLEEIKLSGSSTFNWEVALDEERIELNPGERKPVRLTLEVPRGGDEYTFTSQRLKAKTTDERLEVQESVSTYPRPPKADYTEELRADQLPIDLRFIGRIDEELDPTLHARLSSDEELPAGPEVGIRMRSDDFLDEPGVRDWHAGYKVLRHGITIGHIDKNITPLLSASGLGAVGSYYRPEAGQNFTLFGSDSDSFGLYSQEFDRGDLTLHGGRWEETDEDNIFGALGGYELTEDQRLEVEAVSGEDSAVRIGHEGEWGLITTRTHLFRIGEELPTTRSDEEGGEIEFELSEGSQSLILSLEESWDNIDLDPDEQRLRTTTQGLEVKAGEGDKEFNFGIERQKEKTVREVAGIEPVDELTSRVYFGLRQRARPFGYHLRVRADGNNFKPMVSLTYYESPLYVSSVIDSDSISLTTIYDITSNLSVRGDLYFRERNDYKQPDWELGGNYELTDNLDIEASIEGKGNPDDLGFNVGIGYDIGFDVPLPGVYSEGQLEGELVVEGNPYDLSNVVLTLGAQRVSAQEDGYFRFDPLEEGAYELNIEELPDDLELITELPREVEIKEGETKEVKIRLQQLAFIQGQVMWEEIETDNNLNNNNYNNNNNFNDIEDPGGAENVVLKLTNNSSGNPDNNTDYEITDKRGRFRFNDLTSGNYTVEILKEHLPDRVEIVENGSQDIEIAPGERVEVEFKIKPMELEVIDTFQDEVEIKMESDD